MTETSKAYQLTDGLWPLVKSPPTGLRTRAVCHDVTLLESCCVGHTTLSAVCSLPSWRRIADMARSRAQPDYRKSP